jgi:hypothetical protein
MVLIQTKWELALRTPESAIEYANTYFSYGQPAKAIDFLAEAIRRFPNDVALIERYKVFQLADQEKAAALNGPSLLLLLIVIAFLVFFCSETISTMLESKAPHTVRIIGAVLTFIGGFGLYSVLRQAWMRCKYSK